MSSDGLVNLAERGIENSHNSIKNKLNVMHPSHDRVRQKEKDLMPELSVVECGGLWANISELVQKNVEETLSFFVKPEDLLDVNPNVIKAYYSIGGDASGNNPVYQSKNQHGSPNIIFYAMRLGKIVTGEKELYIEQSLGPNTEVPIGVIPSKESNDEVFEACLRRLEQQIQAAEQSTHHVKVNGKVIDFSFIRDPSTNHIYSFEVGQ